MLYFRLECTTGVKVLLAVNTSCTNSRKLTLKYVNMKKPQHPMDGVVIGAGITMPLFLLEYSGYHA